MAFPPIKLLVVTLKPQILTQSVFPLQKCRISVGNFFPRIIFGDNCKVHSSYIGRVKAGRCSNLQGFHVGNDNSTQD